MGGIVDAIFGGGNETPQVVQRDLKAEQQAADDEAAKKANSERISKKRMKAGGSSSLLATGAKGIGGTADTSSALATGKTTLGQ